MAENSINNNSTGTLAYLQLLQAVLKDRKKLLIFSGVGLFLGILVAFTTPREYQSSSYVLLESEGEGSSLGQMGALAGLAGINVSQLQSGQMALTSEVFPEVIHSRDFLLEISKEKFKFESKNSQIQSLEEYYYEEKPSNIVKKALNFILSIPAIVVGWFASPDPMPANLATSENGQVDYLNLTSQEFFIVGELKKRILIEQKGKLIRLNVSMPEPLIAAQVNSLVLERLIAYVTEYKVGRQRRNIEFIEERVLETEKKFDEAQMRLASFRDANQGLISQRARTREEQLEFEFNIAYNVYNTIKQELEQSAIQLKKETPIFTVLEKAAIPLGSSKPNKPLILIFSIFLGLFVGVLVNLYKVLAENIK
ncbi:Wzz/FepE/Etk N-terminal domain-containing protein [Algoriphagus sp. A40]|uniref:Wzz/FepE/Etk N-terminal domain-containing protein n=1 Tax=Algoriphagus sp. A40 TaxID=1945863 RepID=UPI00098511CE|nr:Wzz/FepE/Etk N-terminal domain-containing protein [Algoriphagus sp. A40]OOG71192.1 hypothetical protein B0E43_17420 [Algoriphagus sp. A40]